MQTILNINTTNSEKPKCNFDFLICNVCIFDFNPNFTCPHQFNYILTNGKVNTKLPIILSLFITRHHSEQTFSCLLFPSQSIARRHSEQTLSCPLFSHSLLQDVIQSKHLSSHVMCYVVLLHVIACM